MGRVSGLETQRGCLKGPGLLLEEQEQLRRRRDQHPRRRRRYLTVSPHTRKAVSLSARPAHGAVN